MKKANVKVVIKNLVLSAIVALVTAATSIMCFADETTPTSLLDSTAMQTVKDFGADLTPTFLALIAIVVPVGLGIWAIKLGVFKGISMLKKQVGGK